MSCLSPKAKKKKEVSKTMCLRNNHKSIELDRLPHVAFEYNYGTF